MKYDNNKLKKHKFNIKTIDEEIEEYEESHYEKYRHIYGISITILLIIIIIFSFVMSPNISLKFASNILSGNFENNTFTVNSTLKIILSENIKKELIQSYKQNKPNEIKLCLIGQIINGDYIINKIFHPKIIEQSVVHVISQGCPQTTLIDIHSHPFDNCLFSNTDFNTYKRVKKTNKKLLMGVMCSENKFLFVNE